MIMKKTVISLVGAVALFAACNSGRALRIEVTDRVISADYIGNGGTLTMRPEPGVPR